MYNPENQYRCTIIRGKSQSDMEDLLPLYANIVHKYCPCEEQMFKSNARRHISKVLFSTDAYMLDRSNKIKRDKLSGSRDWQHIKEQFNLLELSNIIECDSTNLWLNPHESKTISYFLQQSGNITFDCYKYDLSTKEGREGLIDDWREYNGTFHTELHDVKTHFDANIIIADREIQKVKGSAVKSTVDLGDEGEALVFRLEQERVRNFKERLVNKVLLLGKTKGLGYDISSIEADENPEKPEFARYIEVKATKRITNPNFDKTWRDSLNLTAREWIAAEQYGEYYNIYRVYFTKSNTFVIRIKNPYKKATDGKIEVYPTTYQMNFDASVIEKKYDV